MKNFLNDSTRSLILPILSYWFLILLSLGFFLSAIVYYEGFDLEPLIVFTFVTVVGVFFGQVAALLRLRESIGVVHGCLAWVLAAAVLMVGVFEMLGIYLMFYALLGSIFFFAGMWSLRAGRDVWACWPPILYGGGVAVLAANSQGKVSEWASGSKWAIWDVLTLGVFVVVVVTMLIYLAIRERHRLFHWRYGSRATMKSETVKHGAQGKTRMGCGSWAALIFFSVFLSLAAALVAPFLWHTADTEGEEETTSQSTSEEQKNEPSPRDDSSGRKKGSSGSGEEGGDDGEGLEKRIEEMAEQAQEAASNAFNMLYYLVWLLIIFVLLYVVFYRPMNKLFWVRHYRKPLWKIPATARITNYWKLLLIAFRDLDIVVQPSSSSARLSEKAKERLQGEFGAAAVPGLEKSVEIMQRVNFGLGVRPSDVEQMEAVALSAYDTLWARMGSWAQIKSLYRNVKRR